ERIREIIKQPGTHRNGLAFSSVICESAVILTQLSYWVCSRPRRGSCQQPFKIAPRSGWGDFGALVLTRSRHGLISCSDDNQDRADEADTHAAHRGALIARWHTCSRTRRST